MPTEHDADAVAGFDLAAVRFITQGVTAEEAAAVTAVLGSVLQEESDLVRRSPENGQSPWQRSTRQLRSPIVPGPGRWRGFEG